MNFFSKLKLPYPDGALLIISVIPLLFLKMEQNLFPEIIHTAAVFLSSIFCLFASFLLKQKQNTGKKLVILSGVLCEASLLPVILTGPLMALTITLTITGIVFLVTEYLSDKSFAMDEALNLQGTDNAVKSVLAMIFSVMVYQFFLSHNLTYSFYFLITIEILGTSIFLIWAARSEKKFSASFAVLLIVFYAALFIFTELSSINFHITLISGIIFLVILFSQRISIAYYNRNESIVNILLLHPARLLFFTFLTLCIIGTLLLNLPAAITGDDIKLMDSAFTSVSSVCVTGLIVKDTPADFTLFGQICILILIQMGGLGIMTITTVALHVMGQRISLMQEHIMSVMNNTDHSRIIDSLFLVLKFTLIIEVMGALFLSIGFVFGGDSLTTALWRGIFTSVSAFCNAGFSLQSSSLLPYQHNYFILNITSFLIIMGGIAPATGIIIPKWIARKPVPIPARIALLSTVVLLISGTFLFMAFEWNGVLEGLSIPEKILNSWFQSVTLRTAGFNSVPLESISNPAFMVMSAFMFIGGSPGGTAGGIKTTTIAVIILTFWANITNRKDITYRNRRISHETVYRAITIIFSGILTWLLVITMLFTTQNIPGRDLIFEATSAIATVGLSTGATGLLDEIGKAVIIFAMFAGRIGPITLFMILSDKRTDETSRYPEEKIFLT